MQINVTMSFYGSNKCLHGPMEDEHKSWLTKGSPEHTALTEMVFNKKLLGQIHYVNLLFSFLLSTIYIILVIYDSIFYGIIIVLQEHSRIGIFQ